MKIIFSTRFVIHDIDELELARQLTLVDFEIFRRIKVRPPRDGAVPSAALTFPRSQPSELLNQAWSKPHLRHRAPNVTLLTDRFNKVCTIARNSSPCPFVAHFRLWCTPGGLLGDTVHPQEEDHKVESEDGDQMAQRDPAPARDQQLQWYHVRRRRLQPGSLRSPEVH
jgi:hypothetical protein